MQTQEPIRPRPSGRRRRSDAIPLAYRDTAGAIIVSLIGQLALVVSGVLVARMLGVENRGRLALLILFATLVTQLGSLGMPLAMTYWIARQPKSAPRLARSLAGFVSRQVPLLILVQALILFLVLRRMPSYVLAAAAISLVATPAFIGWQYGLGVLQGQQRFGAWNICRLIPAIGYAIVVAGLYIGHIDDLSTVVISWTSLLWIGAGMALSAAARGLRTTLEEGPPLPGNRKMLGFGIKALLGSVSPLQTFNLDQAIVGLFISPAALGIYVVAVSFTNLPYFIAQSVGAVAYPNIAASRDRRYLRRTIARIALAVLVLVVILVVVLEVAIPWLVPRLFGAAFAPSVGVAQILLIYAVLVALRRVLGDCARGAGLPGLSTMDEIAAIACLGPTVLLLVGHGVKGVALAMIISASVGLMVIVVGLVLATSGAETRWGRFVGRRAADPAEHPSSSLVPPDSPILPVVSPARSRSAVAAGDERNRWLPGSPSDEPLTQTVPVRQGSPRDLGALRAPPPKPNMSRASAGYPDPMPVVARVTDPVSYSARVGRKREVRMRRRIAALRDKVSGRSASYPSPVQDQPTQTTPDGEGPRRSEPAPPTWNVTRWSAAELQSGKPDSDRCPGSVRRAPGTNVWLPPQGLANGSTGPVQQHGSKAAETDHSDVDPIEVRLRWMVAEGFQAHSEHAAGGVDADPPPDVRRWLSDSTFVVSGGGARWW